MRSGQMMEVIKLMRRNQRRMSYLKALIRHNAIHGRHRTKRANWLKFCHRCGRDISRTARRVSLCEHCRGPQS